MMRRIYLLFIMIAAVSLGVSAATGTYTEYRDSTLTFKYGEIPIGGYSFDASKEGHIPLWYRERSSVKKIVFDSSFANARPKYCGLWFQGMVNLVSIENIEYLNTSNVTEMSCMFGGCSSLTSLDVSGFNTSNVTEMSCMFGDCSSLTNLDLSAFNTSNVRVMNNMFGGCSSLESLDLSGFDTSNVTNMAAMFDGCSSLATIYCNDVWSSNSSYDMFKDCQKLKGAIEYDDSKTDVTYANPTTGYFTYKVYERLLSINGAAVTNLNESDLAKIDGVAGTASYDNTTKTLTLTDAIIFTNADETSAIQTNLDSLNIVVNGECALGSLKLVGIAGTSHITVKGNGRLLIAGTTGIAQYTAPGVEGSKNSLTVCDGVKLEVQGISGNGIYNTQTITVSGDSTVLRLYGTTGACNNIGALNMNDHLTITDPAGAKFTDGAITDADGNAIKNQWVTISYYENYGIRIADTPVTSINNSDLTIIDGVTGTVTYNNATHTLSLSDAAVTGTVYGIYIDNTIDTLFVNVEGECSIDCANGTGIYSLAKCVKIHGDGTLNISGGKGICMAKTSTNTLWVTDGVKVTVDGTTYGVQGCEYTRRDLVTGYTTILKVDGKKTLLSVKGTTKSYQTIKNFTLSEGYAVTAPKNTVFYVKDPNGTEQHSFCCLTPVFGGKTGAEATFTYTPVANKYVTIEDTTTTAVPEPQPVVHKKGDANGDGSVTMADANLIVNYFLATDKSTVPDIDLETADVNGDGEITMADANMIVNMFLNGDEAEIVGHEYVDLGLSVKWATCNVGATKPEEYGTYFAWGETTGYDKDTERTFEWANYTLTTDGGNTFMTCTDENGNLTSEYDVATKNWGGAWRTPTLAEQQELMNTNNCTWIWYDADNTKYNGVAGYEVTSKKSGYTDKSIFLPATGYRDGSTLDHAGQYGEYWSATLYADDVQRAYNLGFSSSSRQDWYNSRRYSGFSVRPVCP